MRLMGIDYGDKRVGIALSDPLGITAQGLKTIENTGGKKLFEQINVIICEYNVERIVVGLPKNMNNSEGFRTDETKKFIQRLKTYTDKEIILWDERLTTVVAHGYMRELDIRREKKKKIVDTIAASLILENYMSSIK